MCSGRQVYQIKIDSYVNLDWSIVLEEVVIHHTEDGYTILTGALPDQTALHGVLMRIRDLGLSLVEVKRIENKTN